MRFYFLQLAPLFKGYNKYINYVYKTNDFFGNI
jgi:hypothetical protein